MLKSLILLTTVFSLALPAPAAAQSGADARERARELAQERADRARERAQERAERDRDRAQERREREQSGSLDTVVSFDARGSLSVTCPGGTVVVAGAEKNEIRVHARIENGAIRFTSSSARASLEPSSGRGCSDARFEVTVPFGTRVSATTWSGSVSVRGVRGDIEAHAQSGDVHVRDAGDRLDIETLSGDVVVAGVRGEATINTVSGGIALTGARGDVTVESVSGDLDLRDVVSSQIRAHTTSGDIAFLGAILDAGRYEFITHSGEVTLSLPADIGAELGVSTFSGGIESDFPITLKAGEHGIGAAQAKRLTFTVGRGTARIIAETFSGDITLKRRR